MKVQIQVFIRVQSTFLGPVPPQCKERAIVAGKCSKCAPPAKCEETGGGPRWSYLGGQKKCVQFHYYGCGDEDNVYSKNNFESREECDRVCLVEAKKSGNIHFTY